MNLNNEKGNKLKIPDISIGSFFLKDPRGFPFPLMLVFLFTSDEEGEAKVAACVGSKLDPKVIFPLGKYFLGLPLPLPLVFFFTTDEEGEANDAACVGSKLDPKVILPLGKYFLGLPLFLLNEPDPEDEAPTDSVKDKCSY